MSNTTNLNLEKPARGASEWDTSLNSNADKIDAAVGNLQDEVEAARGSAADIDARISESHNADGTHKATSLTVVDWKVSGHTATKVDSNTFRIASADHTGIYTVGRRVNLYSSGDNIMTVTAVEYSGGNTNVDVDGTVPDTISRVDYAYVSDATAPRKITGSLELTELIKASNIHGEITAIGTVSSSPYDIDMAGNAMQTITITGNVKFQATNIPADRATSVVLIITASGADRTITYDTSWLWATDKPTVLASGSKASLTIVNFGATASTIVASYVPLTT